MTLALYAEQFPVEPHVEPVWGPAATVLVTVLTLSAGAVVWLRRRRG